MPIASRDYHSATPPIAARISNAPGAVTLPVCQVKVNEKPGTGFLVAADVVLTTYHLLARVLSRQAPSQLVTVRFEEGPGAQTFRLAQDWLLAMSPISEMDLLPDPKPRQPTHDELDYVLLRLERAPGRERGWLKPPPGQPALEPGSPFHIAQYVNGQGLMVAIREDGVIEVNQEQTRFRHGTWTNGGSSGAPCFDGAWQLVAMHHAHEPEGSASIYNQAIPIDAVRESLPPDIRSELGW